MLKLIKLVNLQLIILTVDIGMSKVGYGWSAVANSAVKFDPLSLTIASLAPLRSLILSLFGWEIFTKLKNQIYFYSFWLQMLCYFLGTFFLSQKRILVLLPHRLKMQLGLQS